MRHKFLVLTVKILLKSVYIYGSYRKIKTGLSLFLDHSVCRNARPGRQIPRHVVIRPNCLSVDSAIIFLCHFHRLLLCLL